MLWNSESRRLAYEPQSKKRPPIKTLFEHAGSAGSEARKGRGRVGPRGECRQVGGVPGRRALTAPWRRLGAFFGWAASTVAMLVWFPVRRSPCANAGTFPSPCCSSLPPAPPPRTGGVMVYDSYRQVLVLHGGDGLNDTWEYDGLDWSLRSTAGPSGVGGAGIALAGAYDSQRHVTVLLHGNQNGMETWEWGGTTWVQRQLAGGTPTSGSGFSVAH